MLTNLSQHLLRILRYAHALLGSTAIVFLLIILANAFIVTVFTVQGNSMYPTLHNGQLLPVSLINYLFTTPKRGQVVIVAYSGDRSVHFVKRIVAIPGDVVPFNDSSVTLRANEYFVEGDNRDHSTDSRSYGPITRDQIIGYVIGQQTTTKLGL